MSGALDGAPGVWTDGVLTDWEGSGLEVKSEETICGGLESLGCEGCEGCEACLRDGRGMGSRLIVCVVDREAVCVEG